MDSSCWFIYFASAIDQIIVSPNMRDFGSQGLWPFPDAIFNLFVGELVEDNWEKLVGFSSV